MTFAAFDWMMSLDPRFFSTIFGVYWFAGSFMAAFAVVIIAATLTRDDPSAFGHHLNLEHFHSLGKFLLAFVAFWAYIAFSQFMLIWIANIPEEVPWYVLRIDGGWRWVGAFLALFHFLVPFFLLLSRDLKRSPRALSALAAWLLLVHWVDLYWLVMPHLHPAGPRPSLLDLTAFVGVGGVAVAFTVLPHARRRARPGSRSLPRGLAEVPAAMTAPHPEHRGHGHGARSEEDRISPGSIVAVGVASLVVFFLASCGRRSRTCACAGRAAAAAHPAGDRPARRSAWSSSSCSSSRCAASATGAARRERLGSLRLGGPRRGRRARPDRAGDGARRAGRPPRAGPGPGPAQEARRIGGQP